MTQINFIDYRLDDKVSYGFSGGPEWRTLSAQLRTTGIDLRRKKWTMPRHKFTIDFTKLHEDAFEELVAMTYVACGSWLAFRFKDVTTRNGYLAEDEPLGTGDGSSDPIQLVKTYVKGPRAFTRIIRLPLSPVIQDEDDNVIAATVDPLTGLATPVGTWPAGKALRWNGEFDVPVYFQDDYNPISLDGPSLSSQRVVLVEELAPLIAVEPEEP